MSKPKQDLEQESVQLTMILLYMVFSRIFLIKLYYAFVDFSKAFDYVVRDNLWFKLIELGVRGNILNVIMSMSNNVKSKVKFNNEKGEEFTCYTGVRQGECLSLFLFSILFNDLENELIVKGVEGLDLHF